MHRQIKRKWMEDITREAEEIGVTVEIDNRVLEPNRKTLQHRGETAQE